MAIPFRACISFLLLAGAVAGQEPRYDLSTASPAVQRAPRWETGLKQPLWMTLAGRKISGPRAHLMVQFDRTPTVADRASLEKAGLRLLDPVSAQAFHASLDLSSNTGRDLQAGHSAALATLGVRALFVPEEDDKLSPELTTGALPRFVLTDETEAEAELRVYFHPDTDLLTARTDLAQVGARLMGDANEYFHRLTVRLAPNALKRLARLDWVQFIEAPAPAPKLLTNRASAELILTSGLQVDPFSLTGKDINLGVFEGLASANREYASRVTNVDRGSANFHTTHVTGTMIASGEFTPDLKGMAPAAKVFAHTLTGDVPARMAEQTAALGLLAINNSWGYPVDDSLGNCNDYGNYRGEERDFDRVVRDKGVAILFAMGNDRDEPICSNLPRAGYYTVGRPASAKNVLTVGAVAAQGEISSFSGAGPARDGRLKPDVTALGVGVRSTNGTTGSQVLSGTSMSTPAVSGTLALLAERYKSKNNGALPDAALLKAIVLNTARDLGNPGPDYTYGYGLMNALDAVRTIDDGSYARDKVGTGTSKTHEIEVAAGAEALRVLLAYSDAPGSPGSLNSIVNHLDLAVTSPDGRTTVLPLGLDPQDPNKDAAPRAGIRDTTKQVVVDKPAAGKWKIEIKGVEVPEGGEQNYAVAWTTAANPAPPCSATTAISADLVSEKQSLIVAHVNSGNQCDPWSVTGAPNWISPVGTQRRTGTAAIKLSVAENASGGPRTARFRIAGQQVEITQNSVCSTEPIQFGQTVQAAFSNRDCYLALDDQAYVRKYEFDGRQGQSVTIAMNSDILDSYILLVAPGNLLLAYDDDSGGQLNSLVPSFGGSFQLPYTGKYIIWATTVDERDIGPFTLKLTEGPSVEGGPATPRALTGCPANVTAEITASSSRAGRRGDLYRTEIFSIPGRIGQEVTVDLTNVSFDPFVYLIGPAGNILGTATNDGSGTVRISARLLQNGPHTVEVTSFSPFQTGGFSLSVQGCSAP